MKRRTRGKVVASRRHLSLQLAPLLAKSLLRFGPSLPQLLCLALGGSQRLSGGRGLAFLLRRSLRRFVQRCGSLGGSLLCFSQLLPQALQL